MPLGHSEQVFFCPSRRIVTLVGSGAVNGGMRCKTQEEGCDVGNIEEGVRNVTWSRGEVPTYLNFVHVGPEEGDLNSCLTRGVPVPTE